MTIKMAYMSSLPVCIELDLKICLSDRHLNEKKHVIKKYETQAVILSKKVL